MTIAIQENKKIELVNVVRNFLEKHTSHVTFVKLDMDENFICMKWLHKEEGESLYIDYDYDKNIFLIPMKILDNVTFEDKVFLHMQAGNIFQNNNVKENEKMVAENGLERVLENGVKVYSLDSFVENDTDIAQSILDVSHVTDMIDADCSYNERVSNNFVGVYEITVERQGDYNSLMNDINRQKFYHKVELSREKRNKAFEMYERGLYTIEHYYRDIEMFNKQAKQCSCKLCKFNLSFEEWKSGKMANGARVGKSMRKAGIKQHIIDLYSLQSKEERTVYFVLSDLAQHIAGMSYYSNMDWDGFGNSSCQDPKHHYEECNRLGASLWDNRLFVGFIIDSLEDLQDMEGKMLARVVFRLVDIELHGEKRPIMLATQYYGNNNTKDLLHNAILKLEHIGIMSTNALEGYDTIRQSTNGTYTLEIYDTVTVDEEIEEEIEVTCPMCQGNGEYTVYSSRLDTHVDTECPMCDGNGSTYVWVNETVYKEVEVSDEIELTPYSECYEHWGNGIAIDVDKEYIENKVTE